MEGAAVFVVTGAVFVAEAAGAEAAVAALAAVSAVGVFALNQSFTPLWPAHAPAFISLDVYEPSLQRPVEPLGAAGA